MDNKTQCKTPDYNPRTKLRTHDWTPMECVISNNRFADTIRSEVKGGKGKECHKGRSLGTRRKRRESNSRRMPTSHAIGDQLQCSGLDIRGRGTRLTEKVRETILSQMSIAKYWRSGRRSIGYLVWFQVQREVSIT